MKAAKLKADMVTIKKCDYCHQPIENERVPVDEEVLIVCNLECATRGVKLYAFAIDPELKVFADGNCRIAVNVLFASPKRERP